MEEVEHTENDFLKKASMSVVELNNYVSIACLLTQNYRSHTSTAE